MLNGPSSSGKTSIGRAMLPLLDDPWFLIPVDAVSGLRSTVHRRQLNDADVAEMLRKTRLGYHRAVAALASVGNHAIMDYPLSEPWRLDDLRHVLQGYDVTMVDVRSSPEVLAHREQVRGDRPQGLAGSQSVYDHADRDITVDTTSTPSQECAQQIVDLMGGLPSPKASNRIRTRAH